MHFAAGAPGQLNLLFEAGIYFCRIIVYFYIIVGNIYIFDPLLIL